MKASNRCKEHNQGDRCTLGRNHDESHVGNFSSWEGDIVVQLYPRTHKRNRQQARDDRYRKSWIKVITLNIRLGALANEYIRSFMNKPEEK